VNENEVKDAIFIRLGEWAYYKNDNKSFKPYAEADSEKAEALCYEFEVEKTGVLKQIELQFERQQLTAIANSTSGDESRWALRHVLFVVENNTITIVGTDGTIMNIATQYDVDFPDVEFLVHARQLKEIIKGMKYTNTLMISAMEDENEPIQHVFMQYKNSETWHFVPEAPQMTDFPKITKLVFPKYNDKVVMSVKVSKAKMWNTAMRLAAALRTDDRMISFENTNVLQFLNKTSGTEGVVEMRPWPYNKAMRKAATHIMNIDTKLFVKMKGLHHPPYYMIAGGRSRPLHVYSGGKKKYGILMHSILMPLRPFK